LQKGVDAVTIDDIVAAARVAKGSFYRYFTDKSELVATLFLPVAEEAGAALRAAEAQFIAARSRTDLTTAWLLMAQRLATAFERYRDPLRLYLQEKRGAPSPARKSILDLATEIDDAAYRLTKAERRRGLLRSDYDLRVGAMVVVGAVEQLAFAFLRGDELGDPEQVARDMISLILNGVRPSPTNKDA